VQVRDTLAYGQAETGKWTPRPMRVRDERLPGTIIADSAIIMLERMGVEVEQAE